MIINVDDLIPRVAYALADLVETVDWRSVMIRVEVDEDYQQMAVSWEDPAGASASISLRGDMGVWDELAEVYREMWNRFSAAGEPWIGSTFSLRADGNVSLTFEYTNEAEVEP